MHIMYFTEQPMSAYPADKGLEFGATALMFPNTHFDPVAGSRLYNEFIEPYVALAAKFSGLDVDFEKDSGIYMNGTMMNDLLVSWVKEHWKCD